LIDFIARIFSRSRDIVRKLNPCTAIIKQGSLRDSFAGGNYECEIARKRTIPRTRAENRLRQVPCRERERELLISRGTASSSQFAGDWRNARNPAIHLRSVVDVLRDSRDSSRACTFIYSSTRPGARRRRKR
jgi:hypothetical protein